MALHLCQVWPQATARALIWRTHKGPEVLTCTQLSGRCSVAPACQVPRARGRPGGRALACITPVTGLCFHTPGPCGRAASHAWCCASGDFGRTPQGAHRSLRQARSQVLHPGPGARVRPPLTLAHPCQAGDSSGRVGGCGGGPCRRATWSWGGPRRPGHLGPHAPKSITHAQMSVPSQADTWPGWPPLLTSLSPPPGALGSPGHPPVPSHGAVLPSSGPRAHTSAGEPLEPPAWETCLGVVETRSDLPPSARPRPSRSSFLPGCLPHRVSPSGAWAPLFSSGPFPPPGYPDMGHFSSKPARRSCSTALPAQRHTGA